MAAPADKTIGDLNGKWVMNKLLSSNPDPALALQGIGWITRKAIGLATITLEVKQYSGPPSPPSESKEPVTHIVISQTGTGGMKGTSETRCLDHEARDHSDWLFGHVRGRSQFVATPADVKDAHLAAGWLTDAAEATGPNGELLIESYVESLDTDWEATQIWGFQTIEGERRYARNILVTKGDERVEIRLVYDYLP